MSDPDGGWGWSRSAGRRRPGRWLQNALALVLVGALLSLGRFQPQVGQRLVETALDTASEWAGVFRLPAEGVRFVGSLIDEINDRQAVEDRFLRGRIELQLWRDRALQLERENQSLRGLLGMKDTASIGRVGAQIIADSGGPFARTFLLDRGEDHGVEPGQAVLSEQGLVGRVVTSGHKVSRALSLTDVNSRIPIYVESPDRQALLIGDNSNEPTVAFAPQEVLESLKAGERVYSSSAGQGLPDGLYIGRLVGDEGNFGVRLPERSVVQDHVLVVDYGLEAFLGPENVEPTE